MAAVKASDEIRSKYRIESVLKEKGIEVHGNGPQRSCRCPFHEDSTASLSVNVDTQVWKCFAGCGQGSVIDLLAKIENVSPEKFLADYARSHGNGSQGSNGKSVKASPPKPEEPEIDVSRLTPTRVYSYRDIFGEEVYQVCRYALPNGKKTFRQRHSVNGRMVWNMDGVERVLFRLPEVMVAEVVWIVEGEKDAENLATLGFCGTCNVGGAGKWLDSYSETLEHQDVVICGDNDEPGKKHIKEVFESVSRKAKTVKLVAVPEPSKDVSDYIATFSKPEEAQRQLQRMMEDAHPHIKGHELPLYTVPELEPFYIRYTAALSNRQVDLSHWLPSLADCVRPMGPGELLVIAGGTGVGKTTMLHSIAKSAKHLPTVFFEAELSREMMFERSVQAAMAQTGRFVESGYASGDTLGPQVLGHHWPKLLICTISGLTVEKMYEYVKRSELKLGERPVVVMVDYIQLVRGIGKTRYERFSDISEGLRRLAVETGTVVIVTSQVGRPGEDHTGEVGLYDAKESGSIENSSAIHLGVWRDKNDATTLFVRVNKATKGGAGKTITCNFDGATNQITERSNQHPMYSEPEPPTETQENLPIP